MRVAVVGAGWAGLAAAVELVCRGAQVTVFEAARQPGGRARSIAWDGLTLDNGPHLLIGAYEATLGLLRQVGVAPETAMLRLPLHVEVPGRFVLRLPRLPAPLHAAAGLLAARGATLAEKLAAARLLDGLRRRGFRLPHDQPVSDWLSAAGQHGALRRHLWEPLCLAALNTPPEEASAQVFANVLRDTLGAERAATDFLLPRVPLGSLLPEPAVRWLRAHGGEVRLSTRVHAIAPDASAGAPRWQVAAGYDAAQAVGTYDAVIIATSLRAAAGLLGGLAGCETIYRQLADFAFEPIGTAYLRYPATVRLPRPLLGLPGPLGQWIFDRGQLDGPPGLLAHVLSARGAWCEMENTELGDALHQELRAILPALPDPQDVLVVREQRATYACRPGLPRPANRTPLSALWLAGDYTAGDYPATLEMAVRSGRAAAQGLLTRGSEANAAEPLVA